MRARFCSCGSYGAMSGANTATKTKNPMTKSAEDGAGIAQHSAERVADEPVWRVLLERDLGDLGDRHVYLPDSLIRGSRKP